MKKCSRYKDGTEKQCINSLMNNEGNIPLENFCKNGFDKNGNARLDTICKDCRRRDRLLIDRSEYSKQYDNSDIGRTLRYKRQGFKINGEDFTVEDYNILLKKQDNKCAICGNSYIGKGKRVEKQNFIVDHDHETGEVRGLLCNGCNRSIGFLGNKRKIKKGNFIFRKFL